MRKVKLIALIAALLTGLLLFFFLNSLSGTSDGIKEEVVTASVLIPENTEITDDMIQVTEISKDALHGDAVTDKDQVVGKAASSEILAGEQILGGKLVSPGESGYDTLAYAITPGMRAITVGVNETTGLSGMLKPRDHVDILAEFEKELPGGGASASTVMITENTVVLAVDSVMSPQGKIAGGETVSAYITITLEVTPKQAMDLSMTEYKGHLRAILRSPLDEKLTNLPAVTMDSVMAQ